MDNIDIESLSKEEFCEFVYTWAMKNYPQYIELDIVVTPLNVKLEPKFIDGIFSMDIESKKIKSRLK